MTLVSDRVVCTPHCNHQVTSHHSYLLLVNMFLLLCPDCCRKVGVPDLCLPLCSHTFNLIEFLDKTHASCSDHLQSIVRCDAGVY